MSPLHRDPWRPADVRQPLLSPYVVQELVARAAEQMAAARREAQAWTAASGREAVRRYTQAVDDTILFLWNEVARAGSRAQPPLDRVALIAQGGYGRAELNLYSDIDLLTLVPDDMHEDEERGILQFFHILWDLHLDLGQATKTAAECLQTIGADVESATALIEARFLAGERERFEMMAAQFEKKLRHQQQRWYLEIRHRDWEERHQRYGASVYLLEPNLKQGEGGLRDIHALRWLAYLFYGTTDLATFVEHDLLAPAEHEALGRSLDMLLRVRNQLHIFEGRKTDVLNLEKQIRVADALGYRSNSDALAEEHFMRDYYALARETFRIGQHVVADLTEPARRRRWIEREKVVDGALRCRGGRLLVAGDERAWFEEDPVRLVAIFGHAAALEAEIAEPTKRALEQTIATLPENALAASPAARDVFLQLLRAPHPAAPALHAMHESGVLGAVIPEWQRLFCMVRADSYHRYTVDEHSLRAVEAADRLRAGDAAAPEILRRQAQRVGRWDLLNLAILIHDIGKGEGHGHVLRGGQIAQRIAARMELPADDGEIVRRLVTDHLKLTHVALRRDLDDPRIIERVARDVGAPDYLRMLYLLTYCDLSAVSPESWTEWKSALLGELFAKTMLLLEGSTAAPRWSGATPEEVLEKVRAHLTTPEDEHAVPLRDYLAELPERYLASTPPPLIAHHYEMIDALDEENRVIWELRHPPGAQYSELTVVTYDRPGVFSVLCGALASKRINILGAQVFSTKGGGVIDRFQITDSRGEPLPEGFVLERLRHDVNRIFLGRKSVEDLFEKLPAERRRESAALQHVAPPSVDVDNQSSDHSTIIEVKGYDRIGLLYDITRIFTKHALSIDLAIITTEAYRVVDVFYVTDSDNNKIDDAGTIERLKQELLEVVSV